MFQAFIDDSKSREDVLVLAGYVSTPIHWARLSTEWGTLLAEYPEWDEFKMARAARHPERARRFYAIAQNNVALYLACVVEINALRKLCRELQLPSMIANPYHIAFKSILVATYASLGRAGFRLPIEFIFDERGEKGALEVGWNSLLEGMPETARAIAQRAPRFGNSRDLPQLQSAELIAWHARKHWLTHREFRSEVELSWPEERPIRGQLVHWDYDALKPNMESLRRRFVSEGLQAL